MGGIHRAGQRGSCQANGQPPVGFLNPAIYALGRSAAYPGLFHDITSGNNENSASPTLFQAVPGYDLCTGWGSPKGSNLIYALGIRLDGDFALQSLQQFCARRIVPQMVPQLGRRGKHRRRAYEKDGLVLHPAEDDLVRSAQDRPIREVRKDIFSSLIFAQQMRIVLARATAPPSAYGFSSATPESNQPLVPVKPSASLDIPWMPDRLNTLAAPICDCVVLAQYDGALSPGPTASAAK